CGRGGRTATERRWSHRGAVRGALRARQGARGAADPFLEHAEDAIRLRGARGNFCAAWGSDTAFAGFGRRRVEPEGSPREAMAWVGGVGRLELALTAP